MLHQAFIPAPRQNIKSCEGDWLIDYLRFYVPLKNFSLILRRHHCRWRAAKFRPMLGAQGVWAGRDLYRATPAVTRDLGFSGLICRNALFSRFLRHTRGSGGSILTRILTGSCEGETSNKCTVPEVPWIKCGFSKILKIFSHTWPQDHETYLDLSQNFNLL
jgi:hypothetical protein